VSGAIESFELRWERSATRHLYGEGAIAAGFAGFGDLARGRKVFVVAARRVMELQGERLLPLRAATERVELLDVPDGEGAKSVAEAERLWRRMSERGGKRDSLVVAFGGGSVLDVAGFAAGAFLRGIEWAAIPTTLLAQVDAAIGGKTGLDLPEMKNAVGLFHPPVAVLAEPGPLATLGRDQRRAGLVEALKLGAVADLALFERVERDLERLLDGEVSALGSLAAAAARSKAALVERDPREGGERQLLNFGHTLGHALEAEAGYGRLAHGDAVAYGMRFALGLSLARGADADFAARVARLLDRIGVPPLPALAPAGLLIRMGRDKKARAEGLTWVLLAGPGAGRLETGIAEEKVATELVAFLRRGGFPPL
jgi:3-dehydroquinate synthase